MKKYLGVTYNNRKEVKTAIFQVLFTANQFIGQKRAAPKRLFKRLFPSVYEIFAIIKKQNKVTLPCLLQSIESLLVIKTISKRINEERPDVPIFTVHDSIATTTGNHLYVKKVMEEELEKALGHNPVLEFEYLNESLTSI